MSGKIDLDDLSRRVAEAYGLDPCDDSDAQPEDLSILAALRAASAAGVAEARALLAEAARMLALLIEKGGDETAASITVQGERIPPDAEAALRDARRAERERAMDVAARSADEWQALVDSAGDREEMAVRRVWEKIRALGDE